MSTPIDACSTVALLDDRYPPPPVMVACARLSAGRWCDPSSADGITFASTQMNPATAPSASARNMRPLFAAQFLKTSAK
jgi:hypothetical protein